MAEIVPVIIAEDFWAVKEKVDCLKHLVDWVQLDIMDGKFVPNHTWNNPEDLKTLKTNLKFEVHLMVEEPENIVEEWFLPSVGRIIFHLESTNKPQITLEKIVEAGIEPGIALNPDTPLKSVEQFIIGPLKCQKITILLMTVFPGLTGQEFKESSIHKISLLREKCPDVRISVDGGVNLKTAPLVLEAGADALSVGSAIWKSEDIKKRIKELKKL